MVEDTTKEKKVKPNIEELGEKLLKFAQETSPEKMELDITKAKKEFGHFRRVLFEAYAFGPEELKKYKIVEGKTSAQLKEAKPPRLSGKGTITIMKYHVDYYNEKYPANEIVNGDSFDITFEDGKIILAKK